MDDAKIDEVCELIHTAEKLGAVFSLQLKIEDLDSMARPELIDRLANEAENIILILGKVNWERRPRN